MKVSKIVLTKEGVFRFYSEGPSPASVNIGGLNISFPDRNYHVKGAGLPEASNVKVGDIIEYEPFGVNFGVFVKIIE